MLRACALALALCAAPACVNAPQNHAIYAGSQDAELRTAVDRARATLPDFWRNYAQPRAGARYTVRAPFAGADGAFVQEWIVVSQRTRGRIDGAFADEPHIAGHHQGEAVSFSENAISDWGIALGDLRYGYYTSRVIISHLPPEQRARTRNFEAGLRSGLP